MVRRLLTLVLVAVLLAGCVTARSASNTEPAGYKAAMRECAAMYRGVSVHEAANGEMIFRVDRLLVGDTEETRRQMRGCVDGKLGKPLRWRSY